MNEPIRLAGVTVRPGDRIYGTRDGLLIVPAEQMSQVLTDALGIHTREERRRTELYG